jgi:hypothetical protein
MGSCRPRWSIPPRRPEHALQRRALLCAGLLPAARAAHAQSAIRIVEAGGARIEVQFDDGFDAALVRIALAWVQRSAEAVALWLGRMPLPAFELLLQAVDGAGVKGGTAFPEPAPYLRLRLGRDTRAAHFTDDWVLVHEMLHLAVPQLPRPQRWLHEGIATYGEGATRVLAGLNPAARWWGALARGLRHGQPQPGDQGLDRTPTWGRTYWGGALFCLLADVQMRRADGARRGLREALHGLVAAGGSHAQVWPVERVLGAADAAVGQSVLSSLYARMRHDPAPVELDALWRDLGVQGNGNAAATLHDDAPLAAIRRAIAA